MPDSDLSEEDRKKKLALLAASLPGEVVSREEAFPRKRRTARNIAMHRAALEEARAEREAKSAAEAVERPKYRVTRSPFAPKLSQTVVPKPKTPLSAPPSLGTPTPGGRPVLARPNPMFAKLEEASEKLRLSSPPASPPISLPPRKPLLAPEEEDNELDDDPKAFRPSPFVRKEGIEGKKPLVQPPKIASFQEEVSKQGTGVTEIVQPKVSQKPLVSPLPKPPSAPLAEKPAEVPAKEDLSQIKLMPKDPALPPSKAKDAGGENVTDDELLSVFEDDEDEDEDDDEDIEEPLKPAVLGRSRPAPAPRTFFAPSVAPQQPVKPIPSENSKTETPKPVIKAQAPAPAAKDLPAPEKPSTPASPSGEPPATIPFPEAKIPAATERKGAVESPAAAVPSPVKPAAASDKNTVLAMASAARSLGLASKRPASAPPPKPASVPEVPAKPVSPPQPAAVEPAKPAERPAISDLFTDDDDIVEVTTPAEKPAPEATARPVTKPGTPPQVPLRPSSKPQVPETPARTTSVVDANEASSSTSIPLLLVDAVAASISITFAILIITKMG